jgi:hypothetical protein
VITVTAEARKTHLTVDLETAGVIAANPTPAPVVNVPMIGALIGVPGTKGQPGDASTVPGPPGETGQQGPPGPPNIRGAWSPVVTYQPEDLVTAGGSTWIATVETTGNNPAADASNTPVGSMTVTSPIPLGSPQSVAMGFTVDRACTVVALNIGQAWIGPSGGMVGIAANINVPGVGIAWLGKNPVQAGGRVDLDTLAALSVGVNYWLVMDEMPTANIQIDQGEDLVGSHMAWNGEFFYGGSEPSNDFKIYGLGVIMFGTSSDAPWQMFVAKGEDGAPGTTPEGMLLAKNNPDISLDADDETFGTWVIADGGTPTSGWPNRGGFSFTPSGGGETVDTFQWNEYGEVRCISAKAATVGLRVFVKQFATSVAHTANVFEVQDDRTNRNVLVAISSNGTLTARNVDRKVVTFPTGSEPSTVGQPDGTLWVEHTP